MKLISWNIDSLNAALTSESKRAQLSRSVLDTIDTYQPDIIGIQETKLAANGPTKKHLTILKERLPEYHIHWRSSKEPARKSYAGTMFLIHQSLNPEIDYPVIGAPDTMDDEGRIITLELEDYFITQVYTPNAGSELLRLPLRQIWDEKYAEYLVQLDKIKPVIAMGDFNVAHTEIDLANPRSNQHSAGFTLEEREGFTHLLNQGFVDTFRYVHGNVEGQYTWWSQLAKTSKVNNSGWRIDYFLVSDRLKDRIDKSEMIDSGPRQDHTPILLTLK